MRLCLCLMLLAVAGLAAGRPPVSPMLHGNLEIRKGQPPEQQLVADSRMHGDDVELDGRVENNRFGRLKLITSWYDACSFRSNTAGRCPCCGKETALLLRDPDEK